MVKQSRRFAVYGVVLSLVLIAVLLISEAFAPSVCPAGYERVGNLPTTFCVVPFGKYAASVESYVSAAHVDIIGQSGPKDLDKYSCPVEGGWIGDYLTGLLVCAKNDQPYMYVLTDHLSSTQPFLVLENIATSIVHTDSVTPLRVSAEGVWFSESTGSQLPNLQDRHIGTTVGTPLFELTYWGMTLVAVQTEVEVRYVPIEDAPDGSEDRVWEQEIPTRMECEKTAFCTGS